MINVDETYACALGCRVDICAMFDCVTTFVGVCVDRTLRTSYGLPSRQFLRHVWMREDLRIVGLKFAWAFRFQNLLLGVTSENAPLCGNDTKVSNV